MNFVGLLNKIEMLKRYYFYEEKEELALKLKKEISDMED
jgi:hypothetical protein